MTIHAFFYKQQFYKQRVLEIQAKIQAKNQAKAKQYSECELLACFLSSTISSKNDKRYSKKGSKNKYVCWNDDIWLMTIKIKLRIKINSHRCDINRPRPRHGHKCTNYKMCFRIMVVIFI